MGMKFAAAIGILLAVPCICFAQSPQTQAQQTQSASQAQSSGQAQASSAQTPLHLDGKVLRARQLYAPTPSYPVDARAAHISGTVVLHAIIGADGRITKLDYVSGPPSLAKSSTDTVRQWLYQPVLVNGRPVEVDTTISVVFTLGDQPPPATLQKPRYDFLFKSDLRDPRSSHVMLTEYVEVGAAGEKKDWADFISAFEGATSRAWLANVSPALSNKKGKVIIGIVVRRDGQLDGSPVIMQPSGDSQVDTATKLAVQIAAPFHPLPAKVQYPAAAVRVTFSYNHPHPLPAAASAQQ